MIGQPMLAKLLAVAALLTLLITTASAYLRLGGNDLGCEGWPACYVAAATPQATRSEPPGTAVVRGAHRVAASVLGLMLIAVVFFGWEALQGSGPRAASIALLGIAVFLAWLGRYTPSSLPAVTLGNLLGAGDLALHAIAPGPHQPGDVQRLPGTVDPRLPHGKLR